MQPRSYDFVKIVRLNCKLYYYIFCLKIIRFDQHYPMYNEQQKKRKEKKIPQAFLLLAPDASQENAQNNWNGYTL